MSSIDFYIPNPTTEDKDQPDQKILTQVLLPQLSNNSNEELVDFFKGGLTNSASKMINLPESKKIISLNSEFGCDLETQLRFMWSKERKDHIKFMQNIKPHQLAVLVPYARFYVSDNAVNAASAVLKNALPISFDKSFDTDYFLKNVDNTSRGEAAGIKSIQVKKAYNITADYDPITLNASFFFSSYDVLMNKPAIDRQYLFGFGYKGSPVAAGNWNFKNFSVDEAANLSYKELLTIPGTGRFKLFLEYGWSVPEEVSSDIINPWEKELIRKFEKVFYAISPVTHNINFEPEGHFSLDVEYVPVPIRVLTETNNFKKSFFSNKKLFKRVEKKLTADHPDLIKGIHEKQKQIVELQASLKVTPKGDEADARRKKIKILEKGIKEGSPAHVYSKIILGALEEVKKYTLHYTIEHHESSEVPKIPNYKTTVYIKINNKEGEKPKSDRGVIRFSKTYELPKLKRKIEAYDTAKKSASTASPSVRAILEADDAGPFFRDEEQLAYIMKVVLPETLPKFEQKWNTGQSKVVFDDVYGSQVDFVLLKDLLDLIYQFVDGDDALELPVCILGNIATPLPNGYRYWCNIGDIPLAMTTVNGAMSNFFRTKPNGSMNEFLHYIFQTIVPSVMSEPGISSALPTISFPYFNFASTKWLVDSRSKTNALISNGLLRGRPHAIDAFAKKYFSDSAFGSGLGCIFAGQTSSLMFENSNIFISKRIEAFSQNFFNNDEKIVDAGIGKLVIGASDGLLRSMAFNSNSDASLKNLNYEFSKSKTSDSPQIISANFQYTMNATLFGNRIYEFSNLVFVPSYSLGKTNPSVPEGTLSDPAIQALEKKLNTDDFEIGGLYAVASVTDNLDLTSNNYTKTISGNTVLRESRLLLSQVKGSTQWRQSQASKRLFPDVANTALSAYIVDNADSIDILKPLPFDKYMERLGQETEGMAARAQNLQSSPLPAIPAPNHSEDALTNVKFGNSLDSAKEATLSLKRKGK